MRIMLSDSMSKRNPPIRSSPHKAHNLPCPDLLARIVAAIDRFLFEIN
jgi:hypothetical protein